MQKFIRKLIILKALLFIVPAVLWAEDVELDKIVVTPSRIEEDYREASRDVEIITSTQIANGGSKNIAQALTDLTSVNISDYGGPGGSKTVRMRGSTAAQVLVLVDGRPVNSPRDGEIDLSTIPLDNIDRVEVLHGPASSLYGSQAMGGVVNIITKNPPKDKQETEAYSAFGTFRTYTERMSHGARIGRLGYIISGEYQSSEGFRANSMFNEKGFNAKFNYELNNNNNFIINSGFNKSRSGTPGKASAPDLDDKQVWLKNFLDFNWQFKPDTTAGLSARIYNNYDRLEFIENTAGSIFDTANSKSVHTTTVRGYDLQFNKEILKDFQIIGGFNYTTNLNNSTSTAKHKYIVRAGYLEGKISLLDKFMINAGIRRDDYSNFGSEINPSLSLLYAINKDNKIHGLVSRSFRAPTFNDLYWPDEGWAKGNPGLSPEKGMTYELGIDTQINKSLFCTLTYYRNKFKDLINWGEDNVVWQPLNVNSALIDGIEFGSKVFMPWNLELGLNYTFLMARDKDTHKYLVYQPRNKVDAIVTYKDEKGLEITLKGQFTDKRFFDPANTSTVKKFFVFGLSISKKLNDTLTFYSSIDNIFNRKYQVLQDYPMPGFSITGGLKADF